LAEHIFKTFFVLLTWVQNGPVRLENKHGMQKKTIYLPQHNLVSRGLNRTNRKSW